MFLNEDCVAGIFKNDGKGSQTIVGPVEGNSDISTMCKTGDAVPASVSDVPEIDYNVPYAPIADRKPYVREAEVYVNGSVLGLPSFWDNNCIEAVQYHNDVSQIWFEVYAKHCPKDNHNLLDRTDILFTLRGSGSVDPMLSYFTSIPRAAAAIGATGLSYMKEAKTGYIYFGDTYIPIGTWSEDMDAHSDGIHISSLCNAKAFGQAPNLMQNMTFAKVCKPIVGINAGHPALVGIQLLNQGH